MNSLMYNNEVRQTIHIIGVELRSNINGINEEIAMLSCNIEIPANMNGSNLYRLNGTIHTSVGDINFGNGQMYCDVPFGNSFSHPSRTH